MNERDYKNYLVTLRPLESFFFGGRKNSEPEEKKDYYVKSRHFPQQTALLGMLRQELLMQNGLFPLNSNNREQAARLIGGKSFNPGCENQDFGVIQEMSPLVLTKDDHFFHPCPKDLGMTLIIEKSEGKSCFNLAKENGETGKEQAGERPFIPHMKGYNPKTGTPELLIANNGCKEWLKYPDVFTESEQVGIKKGREGRTEEEAYYKQVFLRMEKGFSYAFFISLKKDCDNKPVVLKDSIIYMGGERSAFKMTIKEVSEKSGSENIKELFDKTLPDFAEAKIILYSDAYVDAGIINLCKFAVTESCYFRNIRSNVRKTKKFDNLKPRDEESEITPYLGKRLNFLKRGSVLYPDDEDGSIEKIKEMLGKPHFQKIGYNYYKIYTNKIEYTSRQGKE
ncbi:MAG: hypothetical protein KAT34_22760 [Candidatus Aminicenantes bacterium]|nr:hypothetical protein [Candidatus Aminicenantes bacterium]